MSISISKQIIQLIKKSQKIQSNKEINKQTKNKMDKKQKLTYQKSIESYLTQENVYDLFEDLMKSLIVKQPEDPIAYLIDKLANPQSESIFCYQNSVKKVFLVGPPGFKVRQFALQVADHYKFTTISVGDLLKKQVNKKNELGEEIQGYFKKFASVKDQIVINLVKKEIEAIQKQKKSFILSGFPKTRAQGLAMQKAGIFPDAFVIINMDNARLFTNCEEKFKSTQKILDRQVIQQKNKHLNNHCQEYSLNIKQVREIYQNNFFEIDGNNMNREEILEDIARLLKFKIKSKRPRRPAGIIVMGGVKEYRTQVAKKLSKRYGFVYISARELLIEQVGKSSEVGRLALEKMRQKQLIDDSVINGLVQNRLSQVDCQMQGYILQGYPKTSGQAKALTDTHLKPTLIVSLSGGSLDAQLSKEVTQKFQQNTLKLVSNISPEQAFEKVCFELENN